MAIRISPSDADAYAFRGQAKSFQMMFKDALADFNKALELQPNYGEVLDMRGVCKAELGDMTGACEDWKASYENGYNPAFKMMEKFCEMK
jgi:tetratricopeptide (TPR) repeat protein